MRWFLVSILLLSIAGAIMQGTRTHVPAYQKWGSHSELCNTTGPATETWEFEDPIAALTSLLFLAATAEDEVVVGLGGVLASGSFMLHAFETEASRELDFAVAAGLPLFLACRRLPLLGAFLLAVAIVLLYEGWLPELAVFAFGSVGLLGAVVLKKPTWERYVGLLISGLGAGLLIGGHRNTAICENDLREAFVYDARHSGWHVNAAVLLWQAVGILAERERRHVVLIAVAGAVPVIARGVDLHEVSFTAWVVVFSASLAGFGLILALDVLGARERGQGGSFGFM